MGIVQSAAVARGALNGKGISLCGSRRVLLLPSINCPSPKLYPPINADISIVYIYVCMYAYSTNMYIQYICAYACSSLHRCWFCCSLYIPSSSLKFRSYPTKRWNHQSNQQIKILMISHKFNMFGSKPYWYTLFVTICNWIRHLMLKECAGTPLGLAWSNPPLTTGFHLVIALEPLMRETNQLRHPNIARTGRSGSHLPC